MEVIAYSSNWCGYCQRQKEFLITNGIDFKEIDIYESKELFDEFKELGGIGAPFTIKKENGEITAKISGFNNEKLSTELLV